MAELASDVIETCARLPYVGPVCSIIQNIIEHIHVSEEVREACAEEVPKELEMMQITLRLLPESIGELVGDARILCGSRLKQLGRHLQEMQNIVATFGSKNAIKKVITARADKSRIVALRTALATAKQDLLLLLNICAGVKLDEIRAISAGVRSDSRASLDEQLVSDAKLRRSANLMKELEKEYNEIIMPHTMKLEMYRERMGSKYAIAMIVPPYMVTPEERTEIFGMMKAAVAYDPDRYLRPNSNGVQLSVEEKDVVVRALAHVIKYVLNGDLPRLQVYESFHRPCALTVASNDDALGAYWKNVQHHCENGMDILSLKKSWLYRGVDYRLLVEPLDIANWYFRRKNLHSGHYVDGIPENDELMDNDRRPGRYLLVQRKEVELGRMPVSSLGTARQLKKLLGGNSWETYDPGDRAQMA